MSTKKILGIQFKYLGDAVFTTPALFALRQQNPDTEIHILVAKEVAPLFSHLPWINKVWAFPRKRGQSNISESWPYIRDLRNEKFDKSVDFTGNDRGAILSLLIGAKTRLAPTQPKPNFLQKIAYTQTIPIEKLPISWVKRHLKLLELAWQTPAPETIRMSIEPDPGLTEAAKRFLQGRTILCHMGASQPKKEWPIHRWQEFYRLASRAGYKLAFSAGPNDREQNLLADLKVLEPDIFVLPPLSDLSLFLAVLKQTRLVIVGDTGPLHFAAGLGVNVIGLFGTEDSVRHAAPIYSDEQLILGVPCTCTHSLAKFNTCQKQSSCMSSITADRVLDLAEQILGNVAAPN